MNFFLLLGSLALLTASSLYSFSRFINSHIIGVLTICNFLKYFYSFIGALSLGAFANTIIFSSFPDALLHGLAFVFIVVSYYLNNATVQVISDELDDVLNTINEIKEIINEQSELNE